MTALVRLLVTGGRDYADSDEVWRVISTLPDDAVVIHGDANGADTLAGHAAGSRGLRVEKYPAKWREHAAGWCRCRRPLPKACRGAGPRRNHAMLRDGKPTHYYDFPGGTGTADMRGRCVAASVPRWNP